MIKLTEKEIEYIKKSFADAIDYIKQLDTKELIELIRESGDALKDIMMFQEAQYLYENINDNEFANEKVIRAFADANAFSVWLDRQYESAEELYEKIEDKELCSIYEKYLKLINK